MGMSIEDRVREIVRDELKSRLEEIEIRFQRRIDEELKKFLEELEKFRGEISELCERVGKLETNSKNKWNLLLKLRKHTIDQLMTEYRKIAESIRPAEREEGESEETV